MAFNHYITLKAAGADIEPPKDPRTDEDDEWLDYKSFKEKNG